ncbi:hypothetical protein C8R44DRAFT_808571 [Mycena epipterygia]|nr:hypothetical protein C8R44DRAFT_808571 [Mycena epipterygia]
MALQTEVHSSTPTPSSTASAPDPSTSSAGGLTASPPLILAFIAVGLFAVAMIAFFGWSRMTVGRRHWVDPDAVRPGFGETPKLWDVWTPLGQPDAAEWKHIQVSRVRRSETPSLSF